MLLVVNTLAYRVLMSRKEKQLRTSRPLAWCGLRTTVYLNRPYSADSAATSSVVSSAAASALAAAASASAAAFLSAIA